MLRENKELYEFDKFRLDVSERCLLKSGKRVALTDRAFDTLCVLVRHNNRLIGKDELMTEVWADAIVEENNLDKNISALRQILGEKKGRQKFIETVRGHGYRFVAEVRQVDLGFGIADLGFQSGNRNSDERTTANDESTTEDRKPKTKDQKENPQSQISNPKSNVVALAAWRHEVAADGEAGTAEPAINEIQNEPITKAAPSDVAPKIKSNKFRRAALAICALLVTAGIGYALYKFANPSPMIFEAGKTTRITTTGRVKLAAISPDSKLIVYSQEENGEQQSLWMRHITSESSVQIAPSLSVEYRGLNISPDGNSLYYIVGQGSLYQMPVLGGAAKKIADGLYNSSAVSNIGISPDSKQIAFVRRFEKEASALFIVNADGTNEQILAAFEQPVRLFQSVAWSPDGKVIACNELINGKPNVLAVQVADGRSAPILAQNWNSIVQIAWMPDSKSLLMVEVTGRTSQVFYPSGEMRQNIIDTSYIYGTGLASNGRFLAVVKTERVAHIWAMPDSSDANRAKQLTAGFEKIDGAAGLNWMPDGKILYNSYVDFGETWAVDAKDGNSKQISKVGYYQTVSPDGRFVVYQKVATNGSVGLWQMDISDGREKQVTNRIDTFSTFSPDGKYLIFTRFGERVGLWKMPSAGGEPTLVLDENAICPAVSPDGKTIAFILRRAGETNRIALVSFDGGEITKTFDAKLQRNMTDKQNLQWTADGRGIYFVALNDGVSNIRRQPIDGSAPVQVTNFKDGRIFNFAFSPDESQLALSRGTINSDVVLIENAK